MLFNSLKNGDSPGVEWAASKLKPRGEGAPVSAVPIVEVDVVLTHGVEGLAATVVASQVVCPEPECDPSTRDFRCNSETAAYYGCWSRDNGQR